MKKDLYVLTDGHRWIESRKMTGWEAAKAQKEIAQATAGHLLWTKSITAEEAEDMKSKLLMIPEGFLPTRIVTNEYGDARQPEQTDRIDIVFRRSDGWTLGAPEPLNMIAYKLWQHYWTHYHKKGDDQWRPIREFICHEMD